MLCVLKCVVTQPTRIAALSIADRVCRERQCHLGSVVGVNVGMYKKKSYDTRLTYCTTGALLRKLVSAKHMMDFTHVILDEVHERNYEMDFLLLFVRILLRSNSRQVKVILMSATFDVDKFSNYFSVPTETMLVSAPVITIGRKSNFKVQIQFLDELKSLGSVSKTFCKDFPILFV